MLATGTSPGQSRSIREVLSALEWVRGEMMRRGSPDFIRQREAEGRVRELCSRLLHQPASRWAATSASAQRVEK